MQIPRKNLKKYIKIAGLVLAGLLVLAGIAGIIAFYKRESILSALVEKVKKKAKADYNLNVTIDNPHFEGLRTVAFSDVAVVPENRDSLLHISDLHVSVKLFPMLFGEIKLAGLKIKSAKLSLIKRDSIRNYDFLFKKKNDTTATKNKANYAELANNLLNQLLYKIPDDMDVRNFELLVVRDSDILKFFVPAAQINDGNLRSKIIVNDNESVWHIDGTVEPSDQKLDFKLYAEGKKVELPLIEKKLGLKLNFDTVYTSLKDTKKSGDEFHIYGSWAIRNLLINHPKIAANDIVVPAGSIDADLLIGSNYIAVDSSSVIHLKNIEIQPFIKYTASPAKTYELKIRTPELDAQQVFDSFPVGLFESLEGIKVAGKMKYQLDFFLDTRLPDSVRFNSSLNSTGFKILKWGKTNLQKINNPFVYTPYEYGKPMRDITIGPANPDFTPLNQISPYLKNAVLTAEDPSFFTHHGFVEKSIRRSIATDFKEKAFKRGGSTISMQLVKNVFLNRQKTLARKVEEMLIVWLIENNRLSSKQRMLEVYLNLIEWGRNVYGVGEASRYYFNKLPSQLDLGESIFLANIIPRPKSSLYFFEPDGSLRTSLRGYFKLIGNLMAQRGYVSRDTNAYGFYSVRLKESLRRQVAPVDSSAVDSLLQQDEDENNEGMLVPYVKPVKKADTVVVKKADPLAHLKAMLEDSTLSKSEKRKLKREVRRKERDLKRDGQ